MRGMGACGMRCCIPARACRIIYEFFFGTVGSRTSLYNILRMCFAGQDLDSSPCFQLIEICPGYLEICPVYFKVISREAVSCNKFLRSENVCPYRGFNKRRGRLNEGLLFSSFLRSGLFYWVDNSQFAPITKRFVDQFTIFN